MLKRMSHYLSDVCEFEETTWLTYLICSLANKHYLKVADLAALESDYYKAINNYERIGRSSINNHLMKWSVKDYLLKAGICHLATKVCCSQS